MDIDFSRGAWTVGRYGGAPIRIHWSVLILVALFGGFQPGAWLGIVLVIVMHEVGHAVVVRGVGAVPTEIVVHGFGGHCAWRGPVSSRGRAMIAWGGVWGQLVLFALVGLWAQLFTPASPFGGHLIYALLWSNLRLAAFNLIPFPPLDGAEAWRLVPILRDDLVRWWRWQRVRTEMNTPRAEADTPKPRLPADLEAEKNGRITDPETSERLFGKVYQGLIGGAPAGSPDDEEEG